MLVAFEVLSSYYPVLYSQRSLAPSHGSMARAERAERAERFNVAPSAHIKIKPRIGTYYIRITSGITRHRKVTVSPLTAAMAFEILWTTFEVDPSSIHGILTFIPIIFTSNRAP